MKIRKGFVSNSSSSSFVLVGFKLDEDDLNKMVGCIKLERGVTKVDFASNLIARDLSNIEMQDLLLEWEPESWCSYLLVGYGYGRDSATGCGSLDGLEQFKEKSIRLKEKLNIEKDIDIWFGGWYDG